MPRQGNRQQDFTFTIKKSMGVLSTSQTGWTKEVNLVEWNDNPAKLDIRDWDPDHEHMGRGITLHKPETLELLEILLKHFGRDLAEAKARAKAAETFVAAEEDNTPVCDEDGVCCEECGSQQDAAGQEAW